MPSVAAVYASLLLLRYQNSGWSHGTVKRCRQTIVGSRLTTKGWMHRHVALQPGGHLGATIMTEHIDLMISARFTTATPSHQ